MNRSHYFEYIEEKLGTLAQRINVRGKLNILNLHNHSENFYAHFLNSVYGWDLKNENTVRQNVEAIDLVDVTNKRLCQVSATATKKKIEESLKKDSLKNYNGYNFKFISIANDGSDLRKKTFSNPHNLDFDPKSDIIDNTSILSVIGQSTIDNQTAVYQLVKKELGGNVDVIKLDSNLAHIINVLSQENASDSGTINVNPFEIDRKISHNNLVTTRSIIESFVSYFGKVDKKYNEFDLQGSNKSISVLHSINKSYVEVTTNYQSVSTDQIFLLVVENVVNKVTNSANYVTIPIDELELCVNILVVDAFIRCKIFQNPLNYQYASA